MLIFSLVKGVPARTTNVVTVGGVLKREEMDLVMNPHDWKAIEAADYIRRVVGGKTIALTMGPDVKLSPILTRLFDAEVYGADEVYILSDRLMAGADTLATSYTVGRGIVTIVEKHVRAIEQLEDSVPSSPDQLRDVALKLYMDNLIPNRIFSTLPALNDTLIGRYVSGRMDKDTLILELKRAKEDARRFVVVSGIKSTDGETGSVGPQVAEALSEFMGFQLPHATYVDDFEIDSGGGEIRCERKLGRLVQKMVMILPAVLTISPEYMPRRSDPGLLYNARLNSFRNKVRDPRKLNAKDIGAEPSRIGLAGSPTIVGPGVDIGKPPVQKFVNKSLVFYRDVPSINWNDRKIGPFQRGDIAETLPPPLLEEFRSKMDVGIFTLEMMMEELFG
jgi:electron transfer flavoprotein beta subunit